MTALSVLRPEWQRLDLLGACLGRSRRGESLNELEADLRAAQAAVEHLRVGPPWTELAAAAGLDAFDQDILACAAAPEAEPRIGWLFQDLQPGLGSPYPTPALIHEILFLGDGEAPALQARLQPRGALRRAGLIDHGGGLYQPIMPTAKSRELLLGGRPSDFSPPGTREVFERVSWHDLVVADRCLAGLQEIMLWESARQTVEGDWGAKLGGGPVALFAGPSGTGKSLSACALATALDYRLLRADLGLLVSKYVGETEKNLNAIFDAVAGERVILLFDEADALFGKRAEIKDPRDRYANMEVSHLLSRIEQHRGPCVLTTNLRSQLDPAFIRRFHVVIEFVRPDRAARAALWRLHLPPRAPIEDAVNAELLADCVALTGAQIRNSAHRAALLAAAAGRPICLEHLAQAIWRELAKEGRELAPEVLGRLAGYLQEAGP